MPYISEHLLTNLDGLLVDYEKHIRKPSRQLKRYEEEIRNTGTYIQTFKQNLHSLDNKTLVAVDGGRTINQLAGADLIVAGATVADGYRSKPHYGDDPVSVSDVSIIPHSADSEQNFGRRVMFGLELALLGETFKNIDHTIIDGAFINGCSEFVFGLYSRDREAVKKVIELNKTYQIFNIIEELLSLHNNNSSLKAFALTKSDSSYHYSKNIYEEIFKEKDNNSHFSQLDDRKLATRVLNGGEFLTPRLLETNNTLIQKISNTDLPSVASSFTSVVADMKNLFESVKGCLYTTYFKPHEWAKSDRAMKVEFTTSGDPVEVAQQILELIDADCLGTEIMEPYSQYIVDRRAKDVSNATDMAKSFLIDNAEDDEEVADLIRNYRS